MKATQFAFLISLFLLINSLDESTFSNYQDIYMNTLTGEFKIDFDKKIVIGNLEYNFTANTQGEKIVLDTKSLDIKEVENIEIDEDGKKIYTTAEYSLEEKDHPIFGKNLTIKISYEKGDSRLIRIKYETTKEGISAQFLEKEQTLGKKYPIFFTYSPLISGRSLFPCQDTPAVKFTFDLKIIVPEGLKGMIAGIFTGEEDYMEEEGETVNYTAYEYELNNPIPSYLLALAAGNFEEKTITDQIHLFGENEIIDEAYEELSQSLPKAFQLANDYLGPYRWDNYSILILPGSFPYSGMGNPCLSFISTCLINKEDQALIDIIFHNMLLSWSGNLVTNNNWNDYWMGAGITTFLRRKIYGMYIDDDQLAKVDAYLGYFYLKGWLQDFSEDQMELTKLRPELNGISPDYFVTDIPLEKTYNLFYYIENLIGNQTLEEFFKDYFEHFAFQSIDYKQFREYFLEFCGKKGISQEILDQINWDEWMNTPGDLPDKYKISEENQHKQKADNLIERIKTIKEEEFETLKTEFNDLPNLSKAYIILYFYYSDDIDFLPEVQHKFFAESLELYKNQNFLITSYYYYLALGKTDKFIGDELNYFVEFLSKYGVMDYMSGLYYYFYQRDEIKAVETLENLKTFYHKSMYKMAYDEIESATKEFPILEFTIEKDTFNFPNDALTINVTGYKEDLGELSFIDNIYLVSGDNKYELECFIKSIDNQYCKIKDFKQLKSGKYTLNIPERIQKIEYAVKVINTQEFTINQLIDLDNLQTSFEFDLAEKDIITISIPFINETFDQASEIFAYFNDNKTIQFKFEKDDESFTFKFELDKSFIVQEYDIPDDYKTYPINFFTKDDISIFGLELILKDNTSDIKTLSNYKDIRMSYLTGDFKIDFDKKIVQGNLIYMLIPIKNGSEIIFDTKALNIKKVYYIEDIDKNITSEIEFRYGEEDDTLGRQLIIPFNYNTKDKTYYMIRIIYETTEDGTSAQFLEKEQTLGKNHSFFFTQSALISGRSLFPCQDTPAIKFEHYLKIIVPSDLVGMISGIYQEKEDIEEDGKNYTGYVYELKEPIPSYLLALAAGNIQKKSINDQITIYGEEAILADAYEELKDDLPKALQLSIQYLGDYKWEQFNILILPGSFPYSGVENPCLAFISTCLINKDKSLLDIIIHQLVHSWSGNLVSNNNWNDYWLSEGITTFLRRKIYGQLIQEDQLAKMDVYLGYYYLKGWIEDFGEENIELSKLRPDLKEYSPDDYATDIPLEKGYNFMYYIENIIGENNMQDFLKKYFEKFAIKSIDYYKFKGYFLQICKENNIPNEELEKINWTEWMYTPGDLPDKYKISEENKYKMKADELIERIKTIKEEEFETLKTEFNDLPNLSKAYIILYFYYSDDIDFLPEVQHKFFAESLELYKNQNFLITSYYYYLALGKTDKFIGDELKYFVEFLSNYGVMDYMSGLYYYFYQRDEVKAVETLDKLKTFYHKSMYKMAYDEIESAKEEFPILELNAKEETFNYPLDEILLNVTGYKEDLGELNFTDNIYLVSESGEIPIECFIKNKDSQYCNIKDITKIKTGNYKIKVSERIQKINYAVKAQESQSFMINQILDFEKLRDTYKIDFLIKDTFYIKIYLTKETYSKISDIPAIFNNNNDLKLNYIRDDNEFSFNYEINKTFIELHYEITEDYKEYKIDLLSKKGESFLKIDVEIRERKEDENDGIDISTLSNYKDVPINYIYGEFKPDFDNKIIYGELNYNLEAMNDGDKIIFDTSALNIKKVYEVIDPKEDEYRELEFSFGEEDENLGTPLIIHLNYFLGDYIIIKIIYETTENGTSAQFLTKEQTFGKQYPYFYTQSDMILGRSLLPCQDTPDIKFGFDLSIIVPKDLRGMISGIFQSEEIYSKDNNYTKYEYEQKEPPIPSYLIAMAAGNIVERKINDNISVFSEPEYINDVYNELYEDLPKALELAIKYMGPYEWGKYNVLVLPRSFPFSGMENPCLSFLSPCLINGDKSLIDIIFHEMIHSWSGNLVTNENWGDFWLNEGITMFLQRKIVGQMKNDTEYARMDGYLGRYYIKEAIDSFGEEHKDFTTLRPNLTGIDPDDSYSDIPYEKGYNFVYLIEHLIGEEMMEKFFKSYFAHFKYQSLNYYQFKNYFINFCEENSISNETLSKIDWNAWIFTPGDIPEEVNETNRYKEEADSIVEKIKNENFDNLENEFNNLPSVSKTYILLTLEQFEEDFLTEKQHEFLTETLELYTGQNFLVSTNYFRLILEKTDKFYDNETDSLLNYLSNYGAIDYMVGLYGAFYKRDEILAESKLDSLKTFYHSLMYDMAYEEIEEAKKEFPIMMINVEENKKFYYPYDDLFDLNVEEYKEDLGELNIKNNIYLVFQNTNEENKLELNCVINKDNKYCQLQQNKSLELFGKYNIKLDERIQKKEYAIKAKESNKFDIIQLYNETTTETKYSYDYGKSDSLKIIINLIEEIKFDIPIYFNNSKDLKLKCEVKDKNYECELNKTFCESYCTKSKDEVKYKINILSKSEISFLEIEVGIKKSESETSSGDGDTDILVIVLPCAIAALLIIGIIVFLILRKRRLSPENTEEECKELISVGLKDSETKEN